MKYDSASSEKRKANGWPCPCFTSTLFITPKWKLKVKPFSIPCFQISADGRWHRFIKVNSAEINKSFTIARIQSNINPFIFDQSLAERCYCAPYPNIPTKSNSVNIYPNPSKGLFYIDIPGNKGTNSLYY